MRHFTAKLFDRDRQTRQWSVWTDRLTIGSDPRCALVLPAPAPSLAAVLEHDAILELPFGRLDVVEDSSWKYILWDSARERIARSRKLGTREPGEELARARAAVLAGLGVVAVAGMVGLVRLGHRPVPPAETTLPLQIIELVQQDKPEEPKEQPSPAAAPDPRPGPVGGSSEDRTRPDQRIVDPMKQIREESVIAKLKSLDVEALVGDLVDDESDKAADVFLKGDAGASLKKGGLGGLVSGSGDRMDGVAGIGLGNGGPADRGMGTGARPGKLAMGAGGPATSAATRLRVPPPRPTEVELGGDAGTRSPESILRVIRSSIGGFQYSYQKHLRDNPNLGGKISLRFTIAPSGDIVQISLVDSNTGDASLDEEIKDKARRMKFDAIEKGNVTVTYAFVLDRQ